MKLFREYGNLLALLAAFSLLMVPGCGGGGVIVGPYPTYTGIKFINYNVDLTAAAYDQKAPACVYASGTDEYFVAWQDLRDGVDVDIYARFFDTLRADPATTELLVCSASGNQYAPKAAYNSLYEELLVVWEDYEAGDSDIWGQLVDAVSGTLIGGNFPISSVISVDERDPQVTYNPDYNNYLVTWDEDNGTDLDIMGIIVENDGTIPGSAFVITPTAGDQQSAVVAYDTISNRYVVVFMDFAASLTESDLYAQFVDYDGGLIDPDFEICADTDDQDFPAIAFNPDYARFIVTWEDNYFGDYDIVAQEVLGSGLLLGVPIGVCLQSSNQNNAAITYNDYYGEYIILWEDLRYGSADIFGQAFSSNALFLGYNELINDDPVTSIQPAICSRNIAGEYLAAWSGLYSGDYDILGQILY
jgi:hypothetical protein